MDLTITGNPNQAEALKIAAQLGCAVEHRRRTGEIRVTHASDPRGVLINSRRKDSPLALIHMIRKLMRQASAAT